MFYNKLKISQWIHGITRFPIPNSSINWQILTEILTQYSCETDKFQLLNNLQNGNNLITLLFRQVRIKILPQQPTKFRHRGTTPAYIETPINYFYELVLRQILNNSTINCIVIKYQGPIIIPLFCHPINYTTVLEYNRAVEPKLCLQETIENIMVENSIIVWVVT